MLQIGSPVTDKPDQVYAQRLKSNAIVTLEQGAVNEIMAGLPNVRDRHVLPFDPGAVTAAGFDLAANGRPVPCTPAFAREKGVWQVVGDSAGIAGRGSGHRPAHATAATRNHPRDQGLGPDLKPFGLDPPAGRITLTVPNSKTPLTLTVGKSENKLTYVRNSIEPFIYTVPDTSFDSFGNNLSFRDKRAINLVLAKVRSLTITVRGEPPLTLDRSAGGTWSAENARDRMVDTTRAETQASLLCQLQAQTWLGAAKPSYGLDQPGLIFTLQTRRAHRHDAEDRRSPPRRFPRRHGQRNRRCL